MCESTVVPFGKEIWIFEDPNSKWLLVLNSDGVLKFNTKFFDKIFNYFSIYQKEYKMVLKEWVESILKLPIREMQRCSSDLDYLTESLQNPKNEKRWTLKSRYNFNHQLVKTYLQLKEGSTGVKLGMFYTAKLSPQPQVLDALGLTHSNPFPFNPSE